MIFSDKKIHPLFAFLITLLLTACASSPSQLAEEQFEQWEQDAKMGKADAQFKVGATYAAKQDYAKALEWLQRSANQGNAPAQNGLSVMYLKGLGVVRDEKKALDLLQKSAMQGYPKAQYNLAILFKNGRVLAKNDEQAAVWMQQAASQGDVKAQTDLGIMYQLGVGVAKNTNTAIEWFLKAANQGDEEAKNRLGSLYVKSLNSQ
jgi:TPR repeat protein